jgi:hypothetical protein
LKLTLKHATMRLLILLALLSSIGYAAHAQRERKVMIIGIDGCRSDALQQANTPNIDALLPNALYTYDAWHTGITISGPSWSGIMCGVTETKHGVTGNSYSGSNYNQYPYFTTRAKEVKPDLYCVQVSEWDAMTNLVYNDGWDKKILAPDGQGGPTVDSAWIELANPDLDCIFVYFDRVDLTGHATTFSPQNTNYIKAIEFTDSCIGLVVDSLRNRPTYAQEDWLILLITDHGGILFGHGGNTNEERHIWWMASGDAVDHRQFGGPDPGSYRLSGVDTTILDTVPVQNDIAVTALHHLLYDEGVNPEDRADWDLDGKSWLKQATGIKERSANDLAVTIYPNPGTGKFTFGMNTIAGKQLSYIITDITGKVIKQADELSANQFIIDLSAQPAGTYIAIVKVGAQIVTKKLTIIK